MVCFTVPCSLILWRSVRIWIQKRVLKSITWRKLDDISGVLWFHWQPPKWRRSLMKVPDGPVGPLAAGCGRGMKPQYTSSWASSSIPASQLSSRYFCLDLHGFSLCTDYLETEDLQYVQQLIFYATFAFSCTMLNLIIFEILGNPDSNAQVLLLAQGSLLAVLQGMCSAWDQTIVYHLQSMCPTPVLAFWP